MGVEFFVYGGTKRIKIIPHFAVWDRFLYDFLRINHASFILSPNLIFTPSGAKTSIEFFTSSGFLRLIGLLSGVSVKYRHGKLFSSFHCPMRLSLIHI